MLEVGKLRHGRWLATMQLVGALLSAFGVAFLLGGQTILAYLTILIGLAVIGACSSNMEEVEQKLGWSDNN